jgi:hypothetical protein
MELLAIQSDVPFAGISEFSKPRANDELFVTLFGHGITRCPLVVRIQTSQTVNLRRRGDSVPFLDKQTPPLVRPPARLG